MGDRAQGSLTEALLAAAIDRRIFPGAVAEVGCVAGPLWRRACGTLTFDGDAPATTEDTIYDLASLTKPVATTTVTLDLIAKGQMALEQRMSTIVPEWAGADREAVTVQDLLEHTGGLSARLLEPPPDTARAFEHEICAMPLEYRPRTRSLYTDLGFILLAMACERCARRRFAALATELLDACLTAHGADEHAAELLASVPDSARTRAAPTLPLPEDHRRGRRLTGEVHDNYAAVLGGLAGHAGLFGTAPGVGAFARVMLRAALGDRTMPAPFTPATVAKATERSHVPGSSRALGWDTMLPTSSCGTRMSASAFGHVGFTGTSVWVDPARDRYYVLLTNRVCEGGTSEQMQDVRRAFHDAAADI